jgi:hypothetical protein
MILFKRRDKETTVTLAEIDEKIAKLVERYNYYFKGKAMVDDFSGEMYFLSEKHAAKLNYNLVQQEILRHVRYELGIPLEGYKQEEKHGKIHYR